ncbi:type II secretion system major pseudopilin GspG [Hoeflea poritis]|uniref:Type II secretion system core protein G n=1 Tax=Hoeflea poritis TaxID=2993659 RepID=A0ABT4VVU7_9HYPH|nr:type II secretion system major pseudopilin GspG [Hoeflea poritis]MDA4848834.1 type II secretion system major pseudopilin GspG [Hoeflea poritis]
MLKVRQSRKSDQSVRTGEAGFTMVELLVVLAIIGLIASFAVPQVLRYLGSARTDAARIQISNIESAMELYYIDNLRYPDTEPGIAALSVRPDDQQRWNGPYLKDADKLRDPWGNPYTYKLDEEKGNFVISSLGRDGKVGGEGEDADISNFE